MNSTPMLGLMDESAFTEPTEYEPEPLNNGRDSAVLLEMGKAVDEVFDGLMIAQRVTPNNIPESLGYAIAQHTHLDPPDAYGSTWEGDCQAFCHVARGLLSGGFGSAYAQWLGLDPEDRIVLTDLSKAPLGSSLFSKGSTPFGHTWIMARPFPNGAPGSWSTDLWKTGCVGKVLVTASQTKWGHRPLGAGLSVNGYALDLTGKNPPKPKQNKRYQRIERAVQNLGTGIDGLVTARSNLHVALEKAQSQKDAKDESMIQRNITIVTGDIKDMKEELARLQHAYTNARHS